MLETSRCCHWPTASPSSGQRSAWRRQTASTVQDVIPIVEAIAAAMQELGYSQRDVFGMRLAVEEAIVNGVRHGHQYDPTKQVLVQYKVRPDRVLVRIQDEGPGFRPTDVPDPTALDNLARCSGRGLFLMQNYATRVRYNTRGNSVTLSKRPSSRSWSNPSRA